VKGNYGLKISCEKKTLKKKNLKKTTMERGYGIVETTT